MKPVLICRHVEHEGPGYLTDILDAEGIPFELVRVDQGEDPPPSAESVSGLVFMGGPMSVNDPLDWVAAEIRLIRDAMDQAIPVLGHCLGGQLIARAAGAQVRPNPVREIGWHPVRRCDNPGAHEWFGTAGDSFECFHWHGEVFDLPDGATPLLSGEVNDYQAFETGTALALQCHIEMTRDMVVDWSARFADQLQRPSGSVQGREQMLQDLDSRIDGLNRIARHVYRRWIRSLRARSPA